MNTIHRRAYIATVATTPFSSILPGDSGADNLPELEENNAVAVALEYRHKTENFERACSACQLYQGGSDTSVGPCAIYPGKAVTSIGCRKSWVAKTA